MVKVYDDFLSKRDYKNLFNNMTNVDLSWHWGDFIIKNEDLEIIPGALLDIKLFYNEKKSLSVADTSIIFEDEKKYIYKILDNNKIDKIQVVTGVRKDGNLEVLKGLKENDRIVKEGLSRLSKGMVVKPIIN